MSGDGKKVLSGPRAAAEIYKIAINNQNHFRSVVANARQLREDALRRLGEIQDHGCEAASARAYEEGRLAVLDALELGIPLTAEAVDDAIIRMRRLELDAALGHPKLKGSVDDEPIVKR